MQIEQLGRYPAANRVIAHLSDTHLLRGGAPLGGVADTVRALDQVMGSNSPVWATPSMRSS